MDPTQTLKEILSDLRAGGESYGFTKAECENLLEKLENLGEWIKGGGFLPQQWRK